MSKQVIIITFINILLYIRLAKMSAKSEKNQKYFRKPNISNLAFVPHMPSICECNRISRNSHFAQKWFSREDVVVRMKL